MVLMPLRLIIEDDEGTTTIVPLAADAITIGRQQGNTIQLTEKNVSRRHARLFPDSDGWIIEDLNSYNGIKVNGQAAEGRLALKEGDVIQIGDYHLALTEDVDKRSLNFDGRDAANNDPAADPMLASSSSDLPRLSREELAALSSGPQTPQPGAGGMLMDSGPVPAAAMPVSYADDSPRKSATGMLLAAAGVVVVVLIAAVVFLSGGDDPPPRTDAKVATSADSSPPEDATPPSGSSKSMAGQPPGSPGSSPEPVEPPGETGVGEPPPPTEEDAPVAEPETRKEAEPARDRSRKRRQRTRSKKPRSRPEPTPAEPAADPDELLDEARKLQYKNSARAYNLAKQSYGLKRTQGALYVMAFAACRMGDETKARNAIKQLKKGRETMIKSCDKEGIEI